MISLVAKMDGKPWYSIGKGVNVTMMSAGVASGSKSGLLLDHAWLNTNTIAMQLQKNRTVLY
jgi:hypothetical protein